MSIYAETLALYRELLAIPDGYQVLFLQGGAIGQNAIVPMNLLRGKTPRRLRQHRRLGQALDRRGRALLQRQRRRQRRGQRLHRDPAADRLAPRPRGGLRPHLRQRDDHRPRVPLDSGHRRRPAGRRHVVEHPVAADRRRPLRPDLRRRAEEHRPGRTHAGHRSRRSSRRRPGDDAERLQLHRPGRQRLDDQHAADLRDLPRRPGLRLDQEGRRPGGDGRAQPGQGGAALRAPRRRAASTGPGSFRPTARA